MNKDWIQDSLQPQINEFNTYMANFGINIDCGVSSSTHCATALTQDIKTLLDIKWQLHVISALLTFNSQGETDAQAAEVACYQAILDALKKKCP